MERIKTILIEALKAFISVCETYKLRYYACGGTLIGAVRHHGFIPWDDDIDVYMPREDYERLKLLRDEILKENYELSTFEDNGFYPFVKFYSKDYTYWEFECVPVVMAPYLDIFPLDEVNNDFSKVIELDKYYQKNLRNIQLRSTYYLWNQIFVPSFKVSIVRLAKKLIGRKILNLYNQRVFEKMQEKIRAVKGGYCMCYYHSYALEKEVFRKEWFEDYVEMPFESIMIRVPIGYHELLSQVFGDYMKLPPKDKQVSHHNCFYMNLDKRLTISEIRKELKKS